MVVVSIPTRECCNSVPCTVHACECIATYMCVQFEIFILGCPHLIFLMYSFRFCMLAWSVHVCEMLRFYVCIRVDFSGLFL